MYQELVAEFYREKAGHAPYFPFAWEMHLEEVAEVTEEVAGCGCSTCGQWAKDLSNINRARLAKELGDNLVTLYGVAIAAGIDLDSAFLAVHNSNMTKQRTPEGKIQKGDDYVEPDMSLYLNYEWKD